MDIPNYENYIIYEDGRIYSKYKKTFLQLNSVNNKGYKYVDLVKDGKRKKFLIHRLIALCYVNNPKPQEYKLVDHIDRNILNNNKDNLRWCNHSINGFNRDEQSNNKLEIKNIFFCNSYNKYCFRKRFGKKTFSRMFKKLEEAIEYKNKFILACDILSQGIKNYKSKFGLK